jgi:hypothetical protein
MIDNAYIEIISANNAIYTWLMVCVNCKKKIRILKK